MSNRPKARPDDSHQRLRRRLSRFVPRRMRGHFGDGLDDYELRTRRSRFPGRWFLFWLKAAGAMCFCYGLNVKAMIKSAIVPNPVKAVALLQVLFAVSQFWYFFYFILYSSIGDPALFFAPMALLKGLFALVVAYGLLNLREGWRLFVVIVTAMGIVVLPLYLLGVVFSSAFGNFVSTVSGINSLLFIQLFIAGAFLMYLWTYYALTRPSIRVAFSTRKQALR